jgi:hypothetical protein
MMLRDIKSIYPHLLEIKFDTRIIKDSIDRFYIIMLKPLEPLRTNTEHTYKNIIALDPDVRIFLTGFYTGKKIDSSLAIMGSEEAIESRQHPISHEPEDQQNNT